MTRTAKVGTHPCVVVLEKAQGACHKAALVVQIGSVGRNSCANGAVGRGA